MRTIITKSGTTGVAVPYPWLLERGVKKEWGNGEKKLRAIRKVSKERKNNNQQSTYMCRVATRHSSNNNKNQPVYGAETKEQPPHCRTKINFLPPGKKENKQAWPGPQQFLFSVISRQCKNRWATTGSPLAGSPNNQPVHRAKRKVL